MVSDSEKYKDEEEILSGDLSEDSPEASHEEVVDLTPEAGTAALEMDEAEHGGEVPPAEVKLSAEEIAADEAEGVMVKYCLFCRETILADATACRHCGHVVYVFEGGVFKQLWWFFWAGVIAFLGTLLPFNLGGTSGGTVSAFETFPGAFYMLFSIFLVFAMSFNIYSRRLIMGPVFLMFIPAIHCWWLVIGAVGTVIADMCWIKMPELGTIIASRADLSEQALSAAKDIAWHQFLYKIKALNALTAQVGSGMMLILLGSTISSLTFIFSLFSAVTGGGKKKKVKGSKPAKSSGRGRRGRGKS